MDDVAQLLLILDEEGGRERYMRVLSDELGVDSNIVWNKRDA